MAQFPCNAQHKYNMSEKIKIKTKKEKQTSFIMTA